MGSGWILPARQLPQIKELEGAASQPNPSLLFHIKSGINCCVAVGPLPTPHPPEALSHAPLKQIKHLLFRFFSIFFFFTKTCIHTQGIVVLGKTRTLAHTLPLTLSLAHACMHTCMHTHTHTHTHTHKYFPSWPQASTPEASKTVPG